MTLELNRAKHFCRQYRGNVTSPPTPPPHSRELRNPTVRKESVQEGSHNNRLAPTIYIRIAVTKYRIQCYAENKLMRYYDP